MRLHERQSEPSPIGPTIRAYHICTKARAKAISTCTRSGDATRMAKKVDDETEMAKESGVANMIPLTKGEGVSVWRIIFWWMLCPGGRIQG
ncbi:hypothetical protein ACSQ67_024918 [Phaseolus vulgaris]